MHRICHPKSRYTYSSVSIDKSSEDSARLYLPLIIRILKVHQNSRNAVVGIVGVLNDVHVGGDGRGVFALVRGDSTVHVATCIDAYVESVLCKAQRSAPAMVE